jgi:sugar phosphate isomerase/epimerase
MRFAVFTVSVPEWTPEQALEKLAEQGWDGIEFRVLDTPGPAAGEQPDFWKGNRCTLALSTLVADGPRRAQQIRHAGLGLPGIGAYALCSAPEEVELALAGGAAIGAPLVRIRVPGFGAGAATEPYPTIFARAREQYAEVARRAAAHGVRAMVELHHATIVSSPSAALRFLDGLDPRHVGVLHDLGNMLNEGKEHVLSGLEMLGDYLAHVHVKNGRWVPGRRRPDGGLAWSFEWAPLNQGQADLPELFGGLKRIGYDGWVSTEDFSTELPQEERTARNLATLRSLVDG